jgi:hypothetical protein
MARNPTAIETTLLRPGPFAIHEAAIHRGRIERDEPANTLKNPGWG